MPHRLGRLLAALLSVPLLSWPAGAEGLRLRSELHGPRAIVATLQGIDPAARPFDPAAWRLTDAGGAAIPVKAVLAQTATTVLLVPDCDLDVRRVHHLEVLGQRAMVRFDGWFRTLYSAKPLGAEVAPDGTETSFRVFAPRAAAVTLFLYDRADASPAEATRRISLARDKDGVWEVVIRGDLHGTWYDFTVKGPEGAGPADPGNHFFNTLPVHVSDPYARVNDDAQGKSRVWRPTVPATPLPDGRPKLQDIVAYEVHVQDFADRLPVPDALKGTIPAMAMPGLRNSRGEPIGFDYLVDLGINVVHLLPVQEYLHYPDEEWAAAFGDDPLMQSQGVATENYQWGYRTTHAFAIETRYGRRDGEPGSEREQFRDLVQAFHDRGIAVVVDIVPNHTGENMDSRNMFFNFNVLDKHYYYRLDDAGNHIGPFGNEVKTEDRPMVQRWLIDQAKALIAEFGIDGFRIDLAGQIDEQTLIRLRQELGPDVIVYGEPWIDVTDPVVRANPDWDWYKEDAPIAFFQDETRNALVGSPFQLADKATDRGYAGGNADLRAAAMKALTNAWPEEAGDPNRGMNYLDIHDNWTLADRFALAGWDGRQGVDAGPYRVAAGLLFTSIGPLVLHGGSEMLRTKGDAPILHAVKQTATGPIYIKGRDDTYNLRTPNQFDWDSVGRTAADGPNDVAAMHAWWKGLIALRASEVGKVFRPDGPVPPDHYRWFLPGDPALLGYLVGGRVLVLANVGQASGVFDRIDLPAGTWHRVADGQRIDPVAGVDGPHASLAGSASHRLELAPTSLSIWVRQ